MLDKINCDSCRKLKICQAYNNKYYCKKCKKLKITINDNFEPFENVLSDVKELVSDSLTEVDTSK